MSGNGGPGTEPEVAVGADAFVDDGAGMEVAVVGAGAVGSTVAYDLARHGADVTLYERGTVASGATGRAAGICYDAFADPFDADVAGEAIERFRGLAGDDTFAFNECPYVWFAREGDDEAADAIREGVTRMQEHGVVALEMDAEALDERFAAIRTDDVAVAAVAGAAGYVDPAAYTAHLAAAATGAGATLAQGTSVAVRTDPPRVLVGREAAGDADESDADALDPGGAEAVDDGGDADEVREVDAVVVTAGASTKRLLADAGVPIAAKPYRVQAATASVDGEAVAPTEPMWYDATDDVYARPHPDGLLAGDGTEPVEADPTDWARSADDGFAADLVDRLSHRLSDVEFAAEESWAGLCTATPDRDPLVGAVRDGIYVATGFHGQGFMRAPAIGRRLADLVVGAADADDAGLDPYDPARFDGDESFEIVEGLTVADESER